MLHFDTSAKEFVPNKGKMLMSFFGYNPMSVYTRCTLLLLPIFVVEKSFEHIVTQAKYCYNLGVHASLRFSFGLVTINFTRFRMDFLMPLLDGNLG